MTDHALGKKGKGKKESWSCPSGTTSGCFPPFLAAQPTQACPRLLPLGMRRHTKAVGLCLDRHRQFGSSTLPGVLAGVRMLLQGMHRHAKV
eukprot:scaffold2076_cov19-Tisochrysis_lutea.AAC.3